MIANNLTLVYLCSDLENVEDYKIDNDNNCYYKNDFIGKISEKLKDNVLHIYFKPVKAVEYINIEFTIEKS